MQDTGQILIIMQTCALTISATLFIMLTMMRFLAPSTPKEYNIVRRLLSFAMLILSVHFALQLVFGFRAKSVMLGAWVNILFYSPVVYIISYSTVRIICGRANRRRHIFASFLSISLILCVSLIGHICGIPIPISICIIDTLYFLTLVYFTVYPQNEIRSMSKTISGNEPVLYNIYIRRSYTILVFVSLFIPFIIFSNPAILVFTPFFLLSLLFYLLSFIALGFNSENIHNLINETYLEKEQKVVSTSSAECSVVSDVAKRLTDEDKQRVRTALDTWCHNEGYSQPELNSVLLANRLHIPKSLLVDYLREVEGMTFRVWLSNVRIEVAKRLIIEHPEYSNEGIAEACGFTRIYLQNKFKEVTGMTPSEWRDAHK